LGNDVVFLFVVVGALKKLAADTLRVQVRSLKMLTQLPGKKRFASAWVAVQHYK
jgi:hypothetical protein